MAKRRIARAVRKVQSHLVAGLSLDAALAREQMSRVAYQGHLNRPWPQPVRDQGHPNRWFVGLVIAGAVLFFLMAALQSPVVGGVGVLLLSLGLLALDLDWWRRGVHRNWNTGDVYYFDEHPIGFTICILFGLALATMFIAGGIALLWQSM